MTHLPRTLLLIGCTLPVAAAPQEAQQTGFFEKKIRPVLVEHCYKCHAADARNVRGGLLLDSRAGVRKGGDSGPAVVPGDLEESLLIDAIRYDGYEMPPSGKLPDAVIADFEKWVRMGAPDPRDGHVRPATATGIDLVKGREFWSYRPIRQHPVPQPEQSDWPVDDIDRFVLAALEEADMQPASAADRRTLIRRAYFDLIGLPPPPERVAAFVADDSDNAFEKVVDELLASRHFGERWGRHWLDVARYADSTGGGRSAIFGASWRYRNFVIDAFNQDLPFDDFIVEQIAGDLLTADDVRVRRRQLTATGFLAMGPTNYELQDKKQLRMDVIDEQIDTIGRAFLGMTIGCARCHDHKFDPIPTTDYYALAGIFRSTRSLVDGNVSKWITRPLPDITADAADGRRLQEVEAAIKQLRTRARRLRGRLPVVTVDDDDAELVGQWTDSTVIKGFVGRRYIHTTDPKARATFSFTPASTGSVEVLVSHTPGSNRDAGVPVSVLIDGKPAAVVRINQQPVPSIRGGYERVGEFEVARGQAVDVIVSTDGTSGVVIADSVQFVSAGDSNAATARAELSKVEADLAAANDRKKRLSSTGDKKLVVMSVEEEKEPSDFHVCIRGNVRNAGAPVPRGFLSVVSTKSPVIPDGVSGRLQLARWIASSENPLTPRVIVNRTWHHLFGAGIVRTVDNFGTPGERPSHPELLDHLSLDFVRNGWSIKSLVRRIMLSRTYQMSSELVDGDAGDPENRLLARQNRRRNQAEVIRDAILSLSGQLDTSMPEDSVRPGTKSEYGYQFTSLRRSVYLPVFRNRLHDLLAVFDFPDPNSSNGRRNVSTLSTQALYLMNSPFVLKQSRLAARRLLEESSLTDIERMNLLYERALGRPISPKESRLAEAFLASAEGSPQDRWAGLCQAVIGSVDFRYVR